MFNIIEWVKNIVIRGKVVRRPQIKKPPTTRRPPIDTNASNLLYYLNDPTTSDLVVSVPLPKKSNLQFYIDHFVGGGVPLGTIESDAAHCYVTLNNSANYMLSNMKNQVNKWAGTNVLSVFPRAGIDFNAYYDRRNLKFFHNIDPVTQKMVYTSESSDIVAHELGHALLDALRPDLWGVQSLECWAFHEAFGDCNAILHIMQFEQILNHVANEDLTKSNIISRMAEEMGNAIYHLTGGKGMTNGALRDAANNFRYIEPETLPANTPDDRLSHEPHNFSRVWTGTWYEMMVRIYSHEVNQGMEKKTALIKARDVSAKYLLYALNYAPATIRFYDAVAKQMLIVDQSLGGPYQDIMRNVFQKRNVLRENMRMLSDKKINDVKGDKEQFDTLTVVREKEIKTIKLSESFGLMAMSNNSLLNVELEVPADKYYLFSHSGFLLDEIVVSDDELAQAAYACVNYLNNFNMVSPEEKTPFEIQDGKLVRTHFTCEGFFNNAENPEAPEFGKKWKPENNSGCNCCKGTPFPIPEKVKIGCFARTGNINSIKTVGGQGISSIQVC